MNETVTSTPVEAALRQARRERRRGHHRKEMLLLRKAVFCHQESAPLWNRYALSCLRDGKTDEAQKAFAQSAWLDRRNGNPRRAAVTRGLAEQALMGRLGLD